LIPKAFTACAHSAYSAFIVRANSSGDDATGTKAQSLMRRALIPVLDLAWVRADVRLVL